jgi:hypothetical protein
VENVTVMALDVTLDMLALVMSLLDVKPTIGGVPPVLN